MVKPVPVYGAETWTMMKAGKWKLTAMETFKTSYDLDAPRKEKERSTKEVME